MKALCKYYGEWVSGITYWERHHNCCKDKKGNQIYCDGRLFRDPMDGLIWETTKYPKPTLKELQEWMLLPDNELTAPQKTKEQILEEQIANLQDRLEQLEVK